MFGVKASVRSDGKIQKIEEVVDVEEVKGEAEMIGFDDEDIISKFKPDLLMVDEKYVDVKLEAV